MLQCVAKKRMEKGNDLNLKRIFIDLDDVLNYCTMALLSEVGCGVRYSDLDKYDPAWGFDVVRAANELHPDRSFTKDGFWWMIKRGFWLNAEKSAECDWLIQACAEIVGKDNVFILTMPTKDPYCLAGKLEWIHRLLPAWIHRQYVMAPHKEVCASSDSLLIDDADHNVNAFREAGGQAILVPRPWNTMHANDTMDHLRIQLSSVAWVQLSSAAYDTALYDYKKKAHHRG